MLFVYQYQHKYIIKLWVYKHFAPVAQLDRALGYGPGGSGFKS